MQQSFFSESRERLTVATKGALIVLSAYEKMQHTGDAAVPFKQEGNFWYVTGINQPNWRVVIDGSSGDEWLIAPKIDEVHAVFDGLLSISEASKTSGIKHVITSDEGDSLLRRLAKKHSVVYTVDNPPYSDRFGFTLNPALSTNKKMLERIFSSVIDCQKELSKLRAIKTTDEIKQIQRSIDLTIEGFRQAHALLPQATYEYELEAEFSYLFKRRGGHNHAYTPIVASGKNACTLHYSDNNSKLIARNLVLMDIGVSIGGYAADITRTYAKGEISKRKQAVHAAVQNAHAEIISLIKPNLLVEEYAAKVDDVMKTALMSLDLLKNKNDQETYRRYFPHAVSHGLGIDVHDSLGSPRFFESGMVLTVEPGIYIPEEDVGVRIEDDILVTASGHKNMSGKLSTDW